MIMTKKIYFWGIQIWTKVYSTFVVSTLNNCTLRGLVDPENKSQAVTEYALMEAMAVNNL